MKQEIYGLFEVTERGK